MTLFDILSVTSFIALVFIFFAVTDRNPKLLLRFMLAGIALAVANQVGNQGYVLIAVGLVGAAAVFVFIHVT